MIRHRTIVLLSSLLLGLGATGQALAQTLPGPDHGPNERLANQAERISEGILDGSLTAGEAARLQHEQARISGKEQRFLADGNLSPWERRRLLQDEERASRHIWRERHDKQGNMAPTPDPDERLRNEGRRIHAGIADRSLTPGEARRLQHARDRLAAEERRSKSDGNFTPRERQKMVDGENRLSRQTYRQRHDGQRRR